MPEARSSGGGTPDEEADSTASSGESGSASDAGSAKNYKPTDYERAQDQLRRLEALEEGTSNRDKLRIRTLVLGFHNRINELLSRDEVDYGHEVVDPDEDRAAPIPIFRKKPSGVREFAMSDRSFGEFKRGVNKVTNMLGAQYHGEIASILEDKLDTEEQTRQVQEARSEGGGAAETAGEATKEAREVAPVVVGNEPPEGELPPDEEDTPEGPAKKDEGSKDKKGEDKKKEVEKKEEEGWGAAWNKTKWSQITKYWAQRWNKYDKDGNIKTWNEYLKRGLIGYKKGEGLKKWSFRSAKTGKDILFFEWIKWTEGTFLDKINIFSDKFILKFW